MNIKTVVILLFAAAAVAIIAMVGISRQRQAQQSVDPQKIAKVPKTVEANEKQAQMRPAETPAPTESLDSSRLPAVIEKKRPTDFLPEGATIPPLKALETVEIEPNWDEARQHPQLDDTLLSDELKQKIKQSPVPVLLPEAPALLPAARISTGSGWYTAAIETDNIVVGVNGNAKVARVPDTPAAEPPQLGAHQAAVTRVAGIVEVSFKAFGIYYNITVECYDHQTDPRCTEDDYVLELVDALRLAKSES